MTTTNIIDAGVWTAPTWGLIGWTALSVGCVLTYVVSAWLLSRIFHKAGLARWKAWVPIVNSWFYFHLGGRAGGNVFWGIGGYLLLMISVTSLGTYISDNSLTMAPVTCIISMVLAIIALVIFVYKYIASTWNIQKKLGKPGWFLILYFIHVIAPIWTWILALDSSKWNDRKGRRMIK